MKKIIVAIDGYSSCGKSTLAKQLAKILGYIYIDSGAMYRAATFFALENNLITDNYFNEQKFISEIDKISIRFTYDKNDNLTTYLNDQNVEQEIRDIKVSSFVSIISKIPELRKKMVALQREIGKDKAVVMDGRDIGSVVFPDAELKLFITADTDVRALRRFEELKHQNPNISIEEIKNNITERDFIDKNRTESPLIRVRDAIIIDNSNLTKSEQLEIAINLAKKIINGDRN